MSTVEAFFIVVGVIACLAVLFAVAHTLLDYARSGVMTTATKVQAWALGDIRERLEDADKSVTFQAGQIRQIQGELTRKGNFLSTHRGDIDELINKVDQLQAAGDKQWEEKYAHYDELGELRSDVRELAEQVDVIGLATSARDVKVTTQGRKHAALAAEHCALRSGHNAVASRVTLLERAEGQTKQGVADATQLLHTLHTDVDTVDTRLRCLEDQSAENIAAAKALTDLTTTTEVVFPPTTPAAAQVVAGS